VGREEVMPVASAAVADQVAPHHCACSVRLHAGTHFGD
jgi:hypothetical protein